MEALKIKNSYSRRGKRGMAKNKKAWIRIAEAVIGVMIVASVLLFVYAQKNRKTDSSEYIYLLEEKILAEISSNKTLREFILTSNEYSDDINDFIDANLPDNFNFYARICPLESPCSFLQEVNADVYSSEAFISSSLTLYAPKKIKLFVWEM